MKKLRCFVLLMGLLGLAQPSVTNAAVVLGFDPPPPQTFNSGDSVSVGLLVTGLDPEIVSAYDLDVSYDASILNANNVLFSTALGGPGDALENFNKLPGVVNLASVSLLSDADLSTLQGSSVTLATIQFTALSTGDTSSLAYSAWDLKGAGNKELQVVPLPAAVWLFGSGMAGLLGFARAKRGASA